METPVKIYQIDRPVLDLDKLNHPAENEELCFYRFIGGNSSETNELIDQLMDLREEHQLLIGIFRFPFRFEGKKRFQTAATQYYKMKEICDTVIYFYSDDLMDVIDSQTTIREANDTFKSIEDQSINALQQIIDHTGEMNIDFQDISTFIQKHRGPLFIHTVEGESFDEPLKYLISTPYLPEDFTDGKQLMINIGYTRDVNMEDFRQINLRLYDLFSKADLFKIGTYFIDEPGARFKITLIVNGIKDPMDPPNDYKQISKYKSLLKKWQVLSEKGKKRLQLLK